MMGMAKLIVVKITNLYMLYYLTDRRLELLKSSRLSVVAFLNDLPSTKHDLESLTVDVNFVQVSVL